MKITKSNWVVDDHSVRLTMPFAKVDQESRLVSGFATLDNVDQHGDIVLAEASQRAFARFRGNIREMHQPIAAGHMMTMREDEFYDPDTQKFYRGVYVTAYVSKGAPGTWEKVLDGTLSGFSIGGNITDAESEWVKDAGATIRFIKDYDLVELSLVDNPANQLANVFSIQKGADGGTLIKGMLAETTILNVFYCETDGVAKKSADESVDCTHCDTAMTNLGWFESGENDTEKVKELVAKHLGTADTTETGEGGVNVADEKEKKDEEETTVHPDNAEVTPETQAEEANVAEDADAEEEVEKAADEEAAADVDELNTDELDLEKMITDLSDAMKESLEKTVEKVEERVGEVQKSFEEKTSEFEKKLTELGENLDVIKETHEKVAKRLEAVENETAVKKSGDDDSTPEPVTKAGKSDWNGAFLGDL